MKKFNIFLKILKPVAKVELTFDHSWKSQISILRSFLNELQTKIVEITSYFTTGSKIRKSEGIGLSHKCFLSSPKVSYRSTVPLLRYQCRKKNNNKKKKHYNNRRVFRWRRKTLITKCRLGSRQNMAEAK